MQTREFGEARVTFDDRFLPVLIVTFEGANTVEASEWFGARYVEVLERAHARSEKVVSISDASRAERPGPEVRRFYAEWMATIPQHLQDTTLGSIAVITNPLMRGAMTAIGWINEEVRNVESVASLEDGIRLALEKLDSVQAARPDGLQPAEYRAPR